MRKFIASLILIAIFMACQRIYKQEEAYSPNFVKYNEVPRITYFDSTSQIKSIYVEMYEAHLSLYFYPNGAIRGINKCIIIDSFPDVQIFPLSRYNSIITSRYPESYVTPTYWDDFYPNGAVKTKLLPDFNDYSKLSYTSYYLNGNKKMVMQFQHFSFDSLFIPIGDWLAYDSLGNLQKTIPCQTNFYPEDFLEND